VGFLWASREARTDDRAEARGAPGRRDLHTGPRTSVQSERADCPRTHIYDFRKLKSNLQIVDRRPAPPLLSMLRRQQQGEILALLLGDPDLELSLTEISQRTGAPHPSVYREVQRAEQTGLATTRKVGNTRLVRANTDSPYHNGLADVLTRAFGVPALLSETLRQVRGIDEVYVFGSWAARYEGLTAQRPVADIDVLILGAPDRDQLYAALSAAENRLGRPVQATVREAGWLSSGSGSFHQSVTSRPMLKLAAGSD
jgi:predicted nucleotidyltransferase